jgi:hypothetical protein
MYLLVKGAGADAEKEQIARFKELETTILGLLKGSP